MLMVGHVEPKLIKQKINLGGLGGRWEGGGCKNRSIKAR